MTDSGREAFTEYVRALKAYVAPYMEESENDKTGDLEPGTVLC